VALPRRLSVMFWRRLITTWLYLAMVLLSAGPASGASSAQAKPHQGSAELSVALHIWLEASASVGVHTGNVCLSDADTSDVPHAARGATTEVSTAIQTTAHGAERIAGAAATRGGVLSVEQISAVQNAGRVMSQADGAAVHILGAIQRCCVRRAGHYNDLPKSVSEVARSARS
jgi:hypothetical protein